MPESSGPISGRPDGSVKSSTDTYLCGCNVEEKRAYALNVNAAGIASPFKDKQGFQICPEHSARLRNWRSDLGYNASSNMELSFGEDKRDNRDPEQVYAQMKAGSNGHTRMGETPFERREGRGS